MASGDDRGMSPLQMWAVASVVARVLPEGARIHLGAGLTVETVRALAVEMGQPVRAVVHIGDGAPCVIESVSVAVGGVYVEAQGSRPATPKDSTCHGYVSTDSGRTAEPAEVAAALGGVQ